MAANPQRVSYHEISASAPPEHWETVSTLMRLLDSHNRDYHDTKANPRMSLEDHVQDFKFEEKWVEIARQAFQRRQYTPEALLKLGFDLEGARHDPSEAMDVTFPHRKMIYLIPQDTYLDPADPDKIYVFNPDAGT